MDELLPTYYKHLAIKPWDYIVANGLDFTAGCIIKYLSRYRAPERCREDRMDDLLKARACVDALIEREQERRPDNGR